MSVHPQLNMFESTLYEFKLISSDVIQSKYWLKMRLSCGLKADDLSLPLLPMIAWYVIFVIMYLGYEAV